MKSYTYFFCIFTFQSLERNLFYLRHRSIFLQKYKHETFTYNMILFFKINIYLSIVSLDAPLTDIQTHSYFVIALNSKHSLQFISSKLLLENAFKSNNDAKACPKIITRINRKKRTIL